jgi:NADH-quinone oxidoreductase subunit L
MAFFLSYAWLIPALPLLGSALIGFTPLRHSRQASGWAAIGLMLAATALALGLLAAVAGGPAAHAAAGEGFAFPAPTVAQSFIWAPAGAASLRMGIYVDPAAATMLAMVTIAASCIHIFSLGYMAADPRQSRFFSFIALFTAAMLLMTMADNLLLFFMAWEIMGLCSYLLIGFRYERPRAYRAALKAFITTRVGDVLLMLGLAYLWTQAGGLGLGAAEGQIFNPAFLARIGREAGGLGLSHASGIALLIFCGTVGKSAQFPLHVWLPDAMEGPTPVSALIHAATMVAAGVFLVARTYPIFLADNGTALAVVAFIGAFTALFAASIALAQYDIKRILAYSTLSQLGFMVAALGVGGWAAAMFHLLAHAFFKALLFLGSGAIIHAMEATPHVDELHRRDTYAAQQTAQDIRNMGGLRARLPWAFATYTVGYLALAGAFPLAGFWSKDEILADALAHGHLVVYLVLTVASFLTAFYMTRQWRLVFFGAFRGDRPLTYVDPDPAPAHGEHNPPADAAHANQGGHWHEQPLLIAPLAVLASFALLGGLFNLPFDMPGGHWLSAIWGQEPASLSWGVAAVSTLVAATGIAAGWYAYAGAFGAAQDADPLERRAPGLFRLLNQKYRVDELYAASFGRLVALLALASALIDRRVLDPIVDGLGRLALFLGRLSFIVDDSLLNDGPDALASGTNAAGRRTRLLQTGKAQDYLAYLFAGALALAMLYLYVIK